MNFPMLSRYTPRTGPGPRYRRVYPLWRSSQVAGRVIRVPVTALPPPAAPRRLGSARLHRDAVEAHQPQPLPLGSRTLCDLLLQAHLSLGPRGLAPCGPSPASVPASSSAALLPPRHPPALGLRLLPGELEVLHKKVRQRLQVNGTP